MLKILIALLGIILVVIIYSCCKISGSISRLEEMKEVDECQKRV